MGLIAFIPLLLIFYFMLIRPQQKRMREHAELIAALEVGDDVLLTSGIYGTVNNIDRQMLEVEVADGVELRVARNAVSEVVDFDAEDDEDLAELSEAD
ncbi:MAG: preprotein translocase subunit YajC, partial [Actinomycetota bacterium]